MAMTYRPKLILGPGDSIREELEYYGWSQIDLSEILNITQKHLSNILNNKVPISIEIAKALSSVFKQSPEFWINLDTNYRLQLQHSAKKDDIAAKALIFRYMPINQMRKLKWISDDKNQLINEVKNFWDIKELNFDFIDSKISACFRKSSAFSKFNPSYAITWLQKANHEAKKESLNSFNIEKLRTLSESIPEYTYTENGIQKFITELNNCGVIFLHIPHLMQTYTDGASFLIKGNPVIVYTARFNRDDNFWWTITHEIGHILLHLSSGADFFIDSMDDSTIKSLEEKEADNFTNEILKTKQILNEFKAMRSITNAKITQCSDDLIISPSIIVGCLQYNNIVPYTKLNKFKSKAV